MTAKHPPGPPMTLDMCSVVSDTCLRNGRTGLP